LVITKGCKVDHRDYYGQTPIYYAAREGHCEMIQKLVNYGANVNNEDNIGQTPLFYSVREGHRQASEVLINNGAIVNKQDKKHRTPYCLVKKNNKEEIMKLLVNHGTIQIEEVKREKSKSKENQSVNVSEPQKYVLMTYIDGAWRHMNVDETRAFIKDNTEIAKYLTNPQELQNLKLPSIPSSVNLEDHWDKAAKKIIEHIWKLSGAEHFYEPIDIPDYHNIIKNPMDLGTIKNKLNAYKYKSCKEFVGDMELVFSNCITYNGETNDYGELAKELRRKFREQCQVHSLSYYMQQ